MLMANIVPFKMLINRRTSLESGLLATKDRKTRENRKSNHLKNY